MKKILHPYFAIVNFCILSLLVIQACHAQTTGTGDRVGGPCQGCEAIFDFGQRPLQSVDTLPSFNNQGDPLRVWGQVFQKDGITPAADVLLYIYHTNSEGRYQAAPNAKGWAAIHGQLRAWLRTDANGQYALYTCRPGSYPGTDEPAHIHITVKEPNVQEYYIDSIVFQDDPLLTAAQKNRLLNRGGTGVCVPKQLGPIHEVQRDIILGLNIPNYE